APPTAGPTAAPATPAVAHDRAADASPSVIDSSSSAAQIRSAPPTAWMQRAPSSRLKFPASPHTAEATPNTTIPVTATGCGRRRARYAAGIAPSARIALYDVSTRDT